MLTVTTRVALRAELAQARADAAVLGGGRVAFVPVIGPLHEAHLRLVDEARARGDIIVMSIVAHPRPSVPNEAPRDPDRESARARECGVHLLFVPDAAELLPRPPRVLVAPGALDEGGEVIARPGQFARVLTVVAKLFHLVQPDVAVFGQNDAQRAALIRAMVEDLDMPIEIVVAPAALEVRAS